MSRLSQANQLWASLLGKGRGNTARRQTVEQNIGSVPLTNEVLADVTQGMGDTGKRQYIERLLGSGGGFYDRGRSHGGGQGSQHYSPLSGGSSEIHFTDHGTGEQIDQVQMSPEDQMELAKREAMQQEQIDSQLIDTFGSVLQGEYQRQPAAFAEVYRPAITAIASGQMPTAENDAIITSRRRKEGTQRAALVDYLSQNASSLSEADVQDFWQQHYQQYPEFAEGQTPPMTREERIAQQRDQEEQQFQGKLDEFAKSNGLPGIPVRRNEKGVLEPIVNIETMISNQRQVAAASQSAAMSAAYNEFNAELKAAKASVLPKPGVEAIGDPQANARHLASVEASNQRVQAASDKLHRFLNAGGAPAAAPASPPPPADTPQQLPPSAFNNGQAAEAAFRAGRLKAGQAFTTASGKQYVFDDNGVARRVQ